MILLSSCGINFVMCIHFETYTALLCQQLVVQNFWSGFILYVSVL
jgi:hypothetical protein